jgi:hypothetical protein
MMVMVMGVRVLCLETGQWGSCRGDRQTAKLLGSHAALASAWPRCCILLAFGHFDQCGFGFCTRLRLIRKLISIKNLRKQTPPLAHFNSHAVSGHGVL